ncbi:MAG: hypothetical protein A2901_04405 [Elusimicrobia bacterium RIFCSPLOWO2_01_FULL_54_10]|nr:MAG: hypothetical protein A2901_04405 [Elusimicrobia bacterium RIFCSPLOWO2_01_FULL_54_10]
MLDKLIDKSLQNRIFVLCIFGAILCASIYFIQRIPIDAVPDITSVQVVVNTQTGALDPEQIERTVTYPIETEMSGISGVNEVRSLSKYGLSQVVVIFNDDTDVYWARQQVSERLLNVRDELPEGTSPSLAPITTGLGEVIMYVVLPKPGSELAKKSEKERLLYLRTIQDFVIRPHLKTSVQNIAEVDSNGGYAKEIHIEIDPGKLESRGISVEELIERLETLGESFGGGTIQHEGRQVIVRAFGGLSDLEQIRRITVKLDVRGMPIRLGDITQVREDHAQRLGAATYEANETVLGTVLMLSGANSRQVALDSEKVLTEMELPNDVEIKILYSRRFLVESVIKTVAKNLAEGAVLVAVVLFLLLGHLRSAFAVSLAIPISMAGAALGMKYLGISANLMSLGAIDFGLLVDASVVMVENVLRRFKAINAPLTPSQKLTLVRVSCNEVARPVTIGLLIIMAVYVPILSLEGIEGKVFMPMAQTVLMALGASLVVALCLMPVLAYFILRGDFGEIKESYLFAAIQKGYEPVLRWCLKHSKIIVWPIAAVVILSGFMYFRLGADFMPALNEGDMVINLTREASISLDDSIRLQKKSEQIISKFPEVTHVFSRMGTPESATDPMGVNLADTFLILDKSRRERSKGELFDAIHAEIENAVPGQEVMESQPIEMRFNEILEGSRADVTLRIYGRDLDVLLGLLEKSKSVLEKLPGASEVELDALTALRRSPVLNVRLDYEKITRYGTTPAAVNRLLEAAMGGHTVGSFYEQQWRFPIVARITENLRDNPDELKRFPVGLPERGTIPLSAVAVIEENEQVTTIAHEGGRRYAAVSINLEGTDTEGFVKSAKITLDEELKLPKGYHLAWGGQFQNLERARKRLRVIVPLMLAVIFLVIFWHFDRNWRHAIMIFLSVPFAMTGGIFSLSITGIPFSVSASVGFIALAGIAILNAMVLVSFFNELEHEGLSASESAIGGAMIRLRPVLMTALVASLGFLPMAVNTGIGSEVQRPLATVVIGGLMSSTLLTLIVLPALYSWFGASPVPKPDPALPSD